MKTMSARFDRELKKGSAELLVLSLVEHRARHGYEIGKLIDERSNRQIRFKAASLYPLLYRLEQRGWIHGRWVERAGERRKRYYKLTAEGRKVLAAHRSTWDGFVNAIRLITELERA
jgi:PadR family transcriptional regulator, regulatory protein PadR